MAYWKKFAKIQLAVFMLAIVADLLFESVSYITVLYFIGAAIVAVIGFNSLGGGLGRRSFDYLYASSAGVNSMDQELQDMMQENKNSLRNLAEDFPFALFPLFFAAIMDVLTH